MILYFESKVKMLQSMILLACFKTCMAVGPRIVIAVTMIWGAKGSLFLQNTLI
jgi:hypothetical protein